MTNLVRGAALVGAKHDDVWRGIGEFLTVQLLVLLKKLQVSTTALEAICVLLVAVPLDATRSGKQTLKLDLVLNHQRLALGVNWLLKHGRDSVMCGLVLDDQALVANHAIEHRRLLHGPVADVGPLLGVLLLVVLLLRARRLPS